MKKGALLSAAILSLSVCWQGQARADLKEGQQARLFKSVDENLKHVDMAALVDGRPLVLMVGSCS